MKRRPITSHRCIIHGITGIGDRCRWFGYSRHFFGLVRGQEVSAACAVKKRPVADRIWAPFPYRKLTGTVAGTQDETPIQNGTSKTKSPSRPSVLSQIRV